MRQMRIEVRCVIFSRQMEESRSMERRSCGRTILTMRILRWGASTSKAGGRRELLRDDRYATTSDLPETSCACIATILSVTRTFIPIFVTSSLYS